ncbi:MAG: AAA family ATPase [Actinomycetia bacterium]|nr:AAA family ATPase [Actinomycetes bacterium]
MSLQIAVYGKGGIGKSTISANLSACLAASGRRVLQVGCDPKHDSTRLLLCGETVPTVLDYIRDTSPEHYDAQDIIRRGEFGVDCAEAGGPKPGVGCAGRGILTTFELLDRLGVRQRGYDIILYDVLGDVVCGGFAVPIRNEYADQVYVVTSGEFMSLYAANNILRGLENYQLDRPRVAGLIFNAREVPGKGEMDEAKRVMRFAQAVGLPVLLSLPRDTVFAAAEQAGRCLAAAFPESDMTRRFRKLADSLLSGSQTHYARPLTDERLERQVFGDTGVAVDAVVPGNPVAAAAAGAVVPGNPVDAAAAPRASVPRVSAVGETRGAFPRLATAVATVSTVGQSPLLSKALVFKEPLHGCAFNGALSVTTQLRDCVSVAHGPRSCAHIAFQAITSLSRRLLLERGTVLPMQTAPPIVSTDMSESVMVFGGADALRERVEAAKRHQPPAVFVLSTCPSGIIGEDLQAVAALSDATTQVIPIATDGNLTGDYLQGVFLAYQHIAEHLIDRSVKPEHGWVNVVAEKTIANATSKNIDFINEMLVGLGLRLNCRFICESQQAQVKGFMRADLNILAYADYMGLALKGYLVENFAARFFSRPFPVGFAESQEWLGELAAYAGCPERAKMIVSSFEGRYQEEVRRLQPLLAGRRLMVVTYNHNIDWILATALDVGMELAFVGILDYSQDHRFQTQFVEQIGELHTGLEYTAKSRADDVRRVAPDVLLGNYLPSEDLGEAVLDTLPLCPDVGFLSGIALVARWAELLRMDLGEGWRQDADLYRKHRA